jgi:hypothetical protein
MDSLTKYKHARKTGTCWQCGKASVVSMLCQEHRIERNAQAVKDRHRRHRCHRCRLCRKKGHLPGHHLKLGLCARCQKPATHKRYCAKHDVQMRTREVQRAIKRRRRLRKLSIHAGLCGFCFKKPISKFSNHLCIGCLNDRRDWARKKNLSRPPRKEKSSTTKYRRRPVLIRKLVTQKSAPGLGLCRNCLRRPLVKNSKSLCKKCLVTARESMREKAKAKTR